MNKLLQAITDWVSTKRGMWITIIAWFTIMIVISMGPRLNDYKVSNFQSLPDDAKSIIAAEKIKEAFPDDEGTPGILVFHNENGEIDSSNVAKITDAIIAEDIEGVETIINIKELPEAALAGFTSEDKSTMIIPMNLAPDLGSKDYEAINDKVSKIGNEAADSLNDVAFYITGPAGIAGDTIKLFEQADFVLLFATIGIILVLLIGIYRSPLLAFIPLFATVIVYQIVNQSVALMGAAGLEINNQTTSIMSILLFAALIDYSLFVFSRYREELNRYESKYEAMKYAMRATGEPVFFAGGTVLAAMLILLFADFRDYQNFAPIFGTAIFVIMLASITLVPALFTLFGRKAFWPKVPKFGDKKEVKHGIWGPIAKFVVNKPFVTGGIVAVFMVITALNMFNLKFEFDVVKSFPEDMPSRVGYEIVESTFDKGELAPTTVLVESKQEITEAQIEEITGLLSQQDLVASVRLTAQNEDVTSLKYTLALAINPYSNEAIDSLATMREDAKDVLEEAGIDGELHYAGTTAKILDEREINNGDIFTIVSLETLLILVLLFVLTRSWKMPLYMMATILLSFLSALGLGIFLVDTLFGFEAVSSRVPVYSFIFLVALGIDYNIILVSRFIEERKIHKVKDALEIAIRNTGGVISSAGIILAATFAALTTMPVADLFVFGFIVAIGIIIDTFLVRGVLLPALILLFEKDKN
ncbi:MMPL family transporter [Lysinibacillus sp. 54212]|uniref:MMPL family transporter n=1 Tax=Lysinibacillus sp. 54212 TaxID=3119829 RepID=UPI002FC99189